MERWQAVAGDIVNIDDSPCHRYSRLSFPSMINSKAC